ncbi:hypothetical protein C8Q72DRAFT_310723 [Fomitopsis betulina]|nr:hypothetical protein C8Q72DRAFT_310723 [Fomitopsis betulina]
MMGARSASILFDGAVLLLTWMKTRHPGLPSRRMEGNRLSTLLLRNTLHCFSILFTANVIGLAIGRRDDIIERGD